MVLSLNVNGVTLQVDTDPHVPVNKPQESGTGANT
jgi:hypothetical protein